ncbi:GTP pyrophosphokinase [Oceanobacillus sp. CAU 1775]
MIPEKPINKEALDELRIKFTRFGMAYKFALEEISTKVKILQEEFRLVHEYNPIEQINTRVKSAESLMRKVNRKNLPLSLDLIQEEIKDIAGIRIVCSFESDIFQIADMIQSQSDVQVVEVKDYIKNPKPNGYKSYHMVLQIPVFMSDRVVDVYVEMQIRTIAMEFWASLEHKIYYKYDKQIPEDLTRQLKEAADTVADLDRKMENINHEINILKEQDNDDYDNIAFDPRKLMMRMLESNMKE